MESNRFSLHGKTAIVTGAVGLLGKQHCEALAEAGANVVVVDRDLAACRDFAEALAHIYRVKTLPLAVDITNPEALKQGWDAIKTTFGRFDVLVNNAAMNDMFESPTAAAELSQFEHYPLELWQRSLDVNVTGMFLCSQIWGRELAAQGSGSIINIASTYGIVAPDQALYRKPDGTQSFYKSASYPTTKGAVIAFTRFLAAYWGAKQVRVNALSPGGVENNQDEYFVEAYAKRTPLKRMAKRDDYKGALVFLASDASSYMTGTNLVVDGGWTAW